MNLFPLVLYLLSLLVSVLGSLPAPVNLTITSVNFFHVLHWDPGPGTPPGTVYHVFRKNEIKKREWLSNETSFTLRSKTVDAQRELHELTVQASYNKTLSPESNKLLFSPYEDTKITSPKLSLAGCGNCIHINISIPKANKRSQINDIQKFYGGKFKILWKKRNGTVEEPYNTENKSFTLANLKRGVEYCVQVHMNFVVNKNTEPSAWECAFTSIVEPRRGEFTFRADINAVMTVVWCFY
ncbi:cytokine receptor family member b1 [Morone saxatilis]|uniref:cytokine receptor family member b1 n=1 Tax=Morone saxatilis TaxID=34816 RepID=UPI0015E2512F|nr:cytokine receptor family member b1 [Morone saxatilis]